MEPFLVEVEFPNESIDPTESYCMTISKDRWAIREGPPDNDDEECSFILKLVSRGDGTSDPIGAVDNFSQTFRLYHLGQEHHIPGNPDDFKLTYYQFNSSTKSGSLSGDLLSWAKLRKKITLISEDGEQFTISKVLFRSRSEVFEAMFSNETKEKEGVVHFKEVDSSVLEKMVQFLETNSVKNVAEHAIELGHIADQYILPGLFELVEGHLFRNCTLENYEKVLQLAKLHNSSTLYYALGKLAVKNKLPELFELVEGHFMQNCSVENHEKVLTIVKLQNSSKLYYALGLLSATNELPALHKLVEDYFSQNCTEANATQVWELAKLYKSGKLFNALGKLYGYGQ